MEVNAFEGIGARLKRITFSCKWFNKFSQILNILEDTFNCIKTIFRVQLR